LPAADVSGSGSLLRSKTRHSISDPQTAVPYEPSWRSESASPPAAEEQSTVPPPSESLDP
jgi:hypothetical protein